MPERIQQQRGQVSDEFGRTASGVDVPPDKKEANSYECSRPMNLVEESRHSEEDSRYSQSSAANPSHQHIQSAGYRQYREEVMRSVRRLAIDENRIQSRREAG